MRKGEVLGKLVFDYSTHFLKKDVDEYKQTITEFIRSNESLSNEEFYEVFDKQFAMIKLLNHTLTRKYLAKIESGVNTIKIIAIIYLVSSIIAGIIIASELGA